MPHVRLPICSLQASAALEAPLLTMRDIEPPLYHCLLKSLQDVTHTVSCFHTESFQLCSLLRAYHIFASLCNLLCTVWGPASHCACAVLQAAAAALASPTASRKSQSRPAMLAAAATSRQRCLPMGTPWSHRRCTGWVSGTCTAWWGSQSQSWPLQRRWVDLLKAELHYCGAALGVPSKQRLDQVHAWRPQLRLKGPQLSAGPTQRPARNRATALFRLLAESVSL